MPSTIKQSTPIRKGQAISKIDLERRLNFCERALQTLEVRSVNGKKSRLDWANGRPIIFIDEA